MREYDRAKYLKDWDDYNTLPNEEELELSMDLPSPSPMILERLDLIDKAADAPSVVKILAPFLIELVAMVERDEMSPAQLESVFRFICQMTRFRGIFLEEYCKSDEVLSLFFLSFYDLAAFLENSPGRDFCQSLIIIEAVTGRENLIQKFSAGVYDYRTEYLFVAKLFRDARLKGYFMKALDYYRCVPDEELILDRETDLENIIDALGTPGWVEFVPVLSGFLRSGDEVLCLTAAGALGRIGGEDAAAALKGFRREYLEEIIPVEKYVAQFVDLNIIFASLGLKCLLDGVLPRETPLDVVRSAIRIVSGIRDPLVISFLYRLLDDERYEEAEVQYLAESDSYTRQEIHFPLREEAMIALDAYEEDYVVSIVGDGYQYKRDYFYLELDRLYHKKGLQKFWDEEDKPWD